MMKERVYLLSGKIDIHSKINVGTKIQVEVPITELGRYIKDGSKSYDSR